MAFWAKNQIMASYKVVMFEFLNFVIEIAIKDKKTLNEKYDSGLNSLNQQVKCARKIFSTARFVRSI